MQWLQEIETQAKLSTWVNANNTPRVATMNPESVAKLIAAVRLAEKELQRYAKFENWTKERNEDGFLNWMWVSNMQIGNDPGVYARNALFHLQSGEFPTGGDE